MDVKLHKVAPWAASGFVLCVLAVAWFRQGQTGQSDARAHLKDDIAKVDTAMQSRLQNYQTIVQNAAEFAAEQSLGDSAWRRYVRSLDLAEKCPTLFGLGYAAYVPEKGRDPQMSIIPPGPRFDYFIVQQAEPRTRNDHLIGYDFGFDLSARAAAERARDTQTAALSGKLILLDDTDHRAFLLFYPVRAQGVFKGWVFGRFREEDLLKGVSEKSAPVLLQVYDGPTMTKDALFYDSHQPLTSWQKPYHRSGTVVKGFPAAGRIWTVNFTPGSGPDQKVNPSGFFGLVPVLAICLLGLAGVFFWSWMRQRADVVAHQMLKGLRQRETALTLGPHGIVIADATEMDLPIVYVNRAFEKLTGYTGQEVLGKNCRLLQGTDRDQKGLQELRLALKQQRECRVLIRNYRKDGTPFWNDLFVAPVRNDMGRVIQLVAVQQDVTEREQTARRLATEIAIIRSLGESPSLYEAAPRILQAICEAQDWDFGAFWRLDHRSNSLQCIDQWHTTDLELDDFANFIRDTTVIRDAGVPGLVWAKGEQIWLPDLAKESKFPETPLAVQAGLVSACGFPIANRRGLQGVLVFYSRRIWPLSKNLLLLMVGTGAQISQHLDREQLAIEQKDLSILERGLAEFMGEGLIAMDREGICMYVNATAGRLLGYHPRTLLGQNAHEVLHSAASSAACDPSQCPILLSLQSTKAIYVDHLGAVFRRQDHDLLPVAYTASPIVHQDLIQGVVITFVDVSARRAEEKKLRQALEEKEEEIKRIQEMIAQNKPVKQEPNPSDLLVDQIRKLLG